MDAAVQSQKYHFFLLPNSAHQAKASVKHIRGRHSHSVVQL